MATTLIDWRPSVLPAACPSILSAAQSSTAHATTLGFAAGYVMTAMQIDNSMNDATSGLVEQASGNLRGQRDAAISKAKGVDARGIPPRGRRRV
jgi:hypothetical protein